MALNIFLTFISINLLFSFNKINTSTCNIKLSNFLNLLITVILLIMVLFVLNIIPTKKYKGKNYILKFILENYDEQN